MFGSKRSPQIFIVADTADARFHDDLVRCLGVSFAPLDPHIASSRLTSISAVEETTRQEHLLRADIILLVVTASFYGSRSFCDIVITWAIARHRARDALVWVIHPTQCPLDRRLEGVPTLAPESFPIKDRERFWFTCASTIHAAWLREPLMHPRCEDQRSLSVVESLSYHHWKAILGEGADRGAITALQDELRAGPRLRAGDFLGHRFWLLRRTEVDSARETWDAYDRRAQVPVTLYTLRDASESFLAALQQRLRGLAVLRHRATARVLTELSFERGVDVSYYATETCRGIKLHDVVFNDIIPVDVILDGMVSISEALAEGHARGIHHGAVDARHIAINGISGGTTEWKLSWPVSGIATAPRGAAASTPEGDVADLVRTIVFCMHGSSIPPGRSKREIREIIGIQSCSSGLKALLSKNVRPESMKHGSLDEFTQQYTAALRHRAVSLHAMDMEMHNIEGASFWLGARNDDVLARPIERPRRRVKVSSFEIGRYPVTQRLFESVMRTRPSVHVGECCPVHNVTFREALLFCNELSNRMGLTPAYRISEAQVEWLLGADGFRLPTEAEWELAAKGGAERLFPWGDEDPCDRVSWKGAGNELGALSRKGPSSVWSHPEGATPSGIFDMAGNVWEWCWDWFAPYDAWTVDEQDGVVDPIGPRAPRKPTGPAAVEGGAYRILRGGAWNIVDPRWLRTTARSMDLESVRDPDIGFRLARGPRGVASHVD